MWWRSSLRRNKVPQQYSMGRVNSDGRPSLLLARLDFFLFESSCIITHHCPPHNFARTGLVGFSPGFIKGIVAIAFDGYGSHDKNDLPACCSSGDVLAAAALFFQSGPCNARNLASSATASSLASLSFRARVACMHELVVRAFA